MGHTLSLPDRFEFPEEVNGWRFDPEPYNGNAWFSEDRKKAVAVFAIMGTARVAVIDERANGFDNKERVAETSYETADAEADDPWAAERDAAAQMVEQAVEWMEANHARDWTHPDVNEAVFDAPPGYELAEYYIESRTTVIYYRRVDADPERRLAGAGEPDVYTPDTCPYLYIHVWNGSGTATVALAPWLNAHGPDSKHPEVEAVADPPAECGLDVALTMARQYAREHVATDADAAASGQTDLQQFVEGSSP